MSQLTPKITNKKQSSSDHENRLLILEEDNFTDYPETDLLLQTILKDLSDNCKSKEPGSSQKRDRNLNILSTSIFRILHCYRRKIDSEPKESVNSTTNIDNSSNKNETSIESQTSPLKQPTKSPIQSSASPSIQINLLKMKHNRELENLQKELHTLQENYLNAKEEIMASKQLHDNYNSLLRIYHIQCGRIQEQKDLIYKLIYNANIETQNAPTNNDILEPSTNQEKIIEENQDPQINHNSSEVQNQNQNETQQNQQEHTPANQRDQNHQAAINEQLTPNLAESPPPSPIPPTIIKNIRKSKPSSTRIPTTSNSQITKEAIILTGKNSNTSSATLRTKLTNFAKSINLKTELFYCNNMINNKGLILKAMNYNSLLQLHNYLIQYQEKHNDFNIQLKGPKLKKLIFLGIPIGTDEDNILREIENLLNKKPEIYSKSIKEKNNRNTYQYILSLEEQEANNLLNFGYLNLNFNQIKISPYKPIIRCNKCQYYGHSENSCRTPDYRCQYCGRKHKSEKCPIKQKPNRYTCINCYFKNLDDNHDAASPNCYIYRELMERLHT